MPPILALEDVSTTAAGREVALDRVSFVVRPGEVFGIAGVDGNGQSSLPKRSPVSARLSPGAFDLTAPMWRR